MLKRANGKNRFQKNRERTIGWNTFSPIKLIFSFFHSILFFSEQRGPRVKFSKKIVSNFKEGRKNDMLFDT
jgi:hypothetical protein